MPRCYRFAEFTVSPSRRTLTRAGREVPLIPRYFDLLVLLIDRRREAVHRQDILEAVWSDVVVSDGALARRSGHCGGRSGTRRASLSSSARCLATATASSTPKSSRTR